MEGVCWVRAVDFMAAGEQRGARSDGAQVPVKSIPPSGRTGKPYSKSHGASVVSQPRSPIFSTGSVGNSEDWNYNKGCIINTQMLNRMF